MAEKDINARFKKELIQELRSINKTLSIIGVALAQMIPDEPEPLLDKGTKSFNSVDELWKDLEEETE